MRVAVDTPIPRTMDFWFRLITAPRRASGPGRSLGSHQERDTVLSIVGQLVTRITDLEIKPWWEPTQSRSTLV
jgi:hypothetical protein